jgi:monomeric sarcosine oxidase
MTTSYDAIVIGSGAMGSAAAYYLTQQGHKTLLLEQFYLDHQQGSSYGYSRIIRYAYDHPDYIALAHANYALWRDLEVKLGQELLVTSGGLDLGHPDNPRFAEVGNTMRTMNIPFEELTPQQVMQRFPQYHIPDDFMGFYQPDAGVLRTSLCIKGHVNLALQQGLEFKSECKVLAITPSANGVIVETAQGTFQAAHLVITAGAWAGKVLAGLGLQLPLQPTREQLTFFDAPSEYLPPRMPICINWGRVGEEIFYSIPDVTGNGFKAARHFSYENVDPNTLNRTPDKAYEETIRAYLRAFHPAIAQAKLLEAFVCMYTMTPDEHFIIDTHPDYPHIALGAGFSGHGFKFSTLIGKILAELATGQPVKQKIDLFTISRFNH